jgi:hypothetical protein
MEIRKQILPKMARIENHIEDIKLSTLKKFTQALGKNPQWRPELQSNEGSASFTLRARSPTLHLSLGNVLET